MELILLVILIVMLFFYFDVYTLVTNYIIREQSQKNIEKIKIIMKTLDKPV